MVNDLPAIPSKVNSANPLENDLIKAKYQAELDIAVKRSEILLTEELAQKARFEERRLAKQQDHYVQKQAVLNAYLEVAKGLQARSLTIAQYIQTVASAISVLYIAVISLSFGMTNASYRLPARGFIPSFFLGLSLALATGYVAFITKPEATTEEAAKAGDFNAAQLAIRNNFIVWARSTILRRRYLLQASVISLSFGVAALPLPYVSTKTLSAQNLEWLLSFAIALVFIIPGLIHYFDEE